MNIRICINEYFLYIRGREVCSTYYVLILIFKMLLSESWNDIKLSESFS